jgi:hypothetical protein
MSMSDAEVRDALAGNFRSFVSSWLTTIDGVLSNQIPLLSLLNVQQRSALNTARSQIVNQVEPIGLQVIADTSIPAAEVVKRVNEFLRSYGDTLDQQIKLAVSGAQRNSFNGQLDILMESFGEVLAAAADRAGQLAAKAAAGVAKGYGASGSPTTLILGGLAVAVGVAYVWRSFR